MQNHKTPRSQHIGKKPRLGYGNDFLHITQKAWSMKETVEKLDFINIKNFCSTEDNVKKMRRQVTHWEKILAKAHLIKHSYSKYTKRS